jgi:hypothetical protein
MDFQESAAYYMELYHLSLRNFDYWLDDVYFKNSENKPKVLLTNADIGYRMERNGQQTNGRF